MVNQIVNVIVNSKGAVTVKRQLDSIGDSAKATSTYLNGLRAILAAALTFSGVGAIAETIDTFTQLQNRLRQVSDASLTVGQSWEKLLDIANNSYSTIDSTVNLYFRVAQAYKAWGESAESAYEFTELFQKSAILSGSTMQTTAQAVYQFSQALNKGKLDGDEFRSVLEGLPYVASLIQKSLGVTRAELYELSKDGKISVDRIKMAFEDAAKTIRSDFENITPTIGMALVTLRNNWTAFVGDIQTSTGVFSGIAQLILLIANNFNILAMALTPVAAALAFMAGKLVIGLIVDGFKSMYAAIARLVPVIWSLNAALLANPFGLAIVAITAIIGAIFYFREELGLTNEVLMSVWTTATSVFTSIVSFLSPIGDMVALLVNEFLKWDKSFLNIQRLANVTRADIVAMFSAISGAISNFAGYLSKTLAPVFSDLIELATNYYSLVVEIVKLFVDLLAPAIEALLPIFKTLWNFIEPKLKAFVYFLGQVLTGWQNIGNWLAQNFFPIVKDVFEGWIDIIRSVINFINNLISALKQALSLMSKLGSGGGGGGGKGANYGAQFYAGEFNGGGGFKVGGTGAGRDTTPVAFRANRGERVTVETQKQQRANDNSPSVDVNVTPQIINVLDSKSMLGLLDSAEGHRQIINVLKYEREEVQRILGPT